MSNPLEIAGNPFRVSLIDKDRGVVAYVLFDSYVRLFAAAPIGEEIVCFLEEALPEEQLTYNSNELCKLVRRYRAVCPKEE